MSREFNLLGTIFGTLQNSKAYWLLNRRILIFEV